MTAPSFDNWTIVFLLFSFLGIVTSILMQFQSKENRKGRLLISILLILFSFTLIEYVLFWTRFIFYLPHFTNISLSFFLAFGPLLYIYVTIAERGCIKKKDLSHFIPFIIALLICLPFYFQNSAFKKNLMLNGLPIGSAYNFIFISITWLGVLHMFMYSYFILKKRRVFNEFLLIKKWVTLLSFCLFGIALSMLTYIILNRLGILKLEWDYMISFSMCIFIVLITIACYAKPQVFNDTKLFSFKEIELSLSKYKNSPINSSMSIELSKKIHDVIVENSLWQKNDLRLDDLSLKMELPKHYISQVINEQFNMNFFEFINKYRIDEAKTLIELNNQKTLIEVAYQVGFNNKVSFAKAFRKNTNLSPTEYRNSLK